MKINNSQISLLVGLGNPFMIAPSTSFDGVIIRVKGVGEGAIPRTLLTDRDKVRFFQECFANKDFLSILREATIYSQYIEFEEIK